ncbi:MAG: dihydropteroate synthase [Gemmatimonadetes bacterium]|nr:MAG: dihydropteroate synthase [Gemmatimonadota bacterium]
MKRRNSDFAPAVFRCRKFRLDFSTHTHIMGILNVTPDSFSDGGKYLNPERAVERALEMVQAGADIIDVGGESSRPGSDPISASEEVDRVLPVIEQLAPLLSCPISIDTYKVPVAEAALTAGASIINDISGAQFEPAMANVAAQFDAGMVLMHIRGNPKTMQNAIRYEHLIEEITGYLQKCIEHVRRAGVGADQILIDPGIGFGKTVEHNLQILHHLDQFQTLPYPILVGASRKSFIGKVLKDSTASRLEGSLVAAILAAERGAAVVRVHDVAETRRALTLADAIFCAKSVT